MKASSTFYSPDGKRLIEVTPGAPMPREAAIADILEEISRYAPPMIAGGLCATLREDNAPPALVEEAEALMAKVLRWWAARDVAASGGSEPPR